MLLPRVLTAAVGIPLVLYFIFVGGVPFVAFVLALTALALHEYATLLWLGGRGVQRILTVAGGSAVALALALAGPGGFGTLGGALLHLTLTGVVLAALLTELFRKEHSLDRAAVSVFGTLFIGWTLAHLALIRDLGPNGRAWTFLLFAAVWATDTAAYFTGRALGRRKLAMVVSPKKTWEGAAGGALGALLTVWLARRFFPEGVLEPALVLELGLLVGVVGQLSDLCQSLVKRAAGAKDSGTLLPGHGGVFDRMDSFLLLAPLYYYVLLLARL